MTTEEVARFPWKRIFEVLDMDPQSPDKKKLFSYLEENLSEWTAKRSAFGGGAGQTVVDAAFAKEAAKNLHPLLSSAGNVIDFNTLIGLYAFKTETAPSEENLAHIREQMRLYFKQHPDTFAITGKGIAKVFRLADAKGKSTGVEVPEAGAVVAAAGEGGFRGHGKPFQVAAGRIGVDSSLAGYEAFKGWCKRGKKPVNTISLAEYAKYQAK